MSCFTRRQTPDQSCPETEEPRQDGWLPSLLGNSFMQSLFSDTSTPASVFGTGAANGRQGTVLTQANRAYEAGRTAPHAGYDDTVWRAVDTFDPKTGQPTRWEGYADHRWGDMNGGRYHDPGSRLIYTSPSKTESLGELAAYPNEDGSHPMKNKTMVEMRYDAQGKMADVSGHLDERGIRRSAVTAQKGKLGPDRLHRLTGEDPYLYARAMGQGAMDSGASSMKVPSATGGNQIDIIPRNNASNAITPLEVTPFDAHGTAGTPSRANVPGGPSINGMGLDATPIVEGPIPHGPGSSLRPATTSEPTPPGRASSVRYGAIGGGLAALGTDLYRMANGEDVGLGQTVLDTGVGTAVGAGGALATDALMAAGRGATSAGGIVGGVIEGGMSLWNNANAYADGKIDGSHAIANTVVDTGIGVGAGAAGAAMGAAIGSIIPGAGTLVGAGLGSLGGMAGSYLVHALADGTGFTGWAKEGLANGLSWAGDGLATAGGAIADGAGALWEGAKGVGSSIAEGAGAAWEGAKGVGSSIANGASAAWDTLTSW